jgi:hypothetical protein
MAVLLCASASFAKKAMDEEEMDLVTAAGQPSVISISVEQSGVDNLTSTTTSDSTIQAETDTTGNNVAGIQSLQAASTDPTAFAANAALGIGDVSILGGLIELENASAGLQLDFADADIETFSQAVGPGVLATLTATSSASTSTDISAGDVTVTAENVDNSTVALNVEVDSQSFLRAVTLNNVAGENQLATGINIASSAFKASGSQDNTINQSWGSTYDWSYAPGFGVTATASADGGDGGDGGELESGGKIVNQPCVLATCSNTADGGAGAPGAAAAAVAVVDNLPLTITADKIIKVDVESQGSSDVDVSEIDNSTVAGVISTGSQTNLSALAVNNIVGRNQVGTALNVVTAGALSIGDQGGTPRLSFGVPAVGGQSVNSVAQSNTINQYRGTPQGH